MLLGKFTMSFSVRALVTMLPAGNVTKRVRKWISKNTDGHLELHFRRDSVD
jgi:hypothetical protein